jgi:hypothetical protein
MSMVRRCGTAGTGNSIGEKSPPPHKEKKGDTGKELFSTGSLRRISIILNFFELVYF